MKAYVISLARSADRRAHMARELRKTGMEHEFIEGVDGTKLDLRNSSIVSPVSLGRGPVKEGSWGGDRSLSGVAGCALSHVKVYRKIVEDGARAALVLEDDVILPADIDDIAEAAAGHMTGAEAVLLQYGNVSAIRGRALRLSRATAVQLPGSRILAFPAEIADLNCTGAYLITREACELMARETPPVRVPSDDWAFHFARHALHRVRCVAPMAVEIDKKFRTTINQFDPRSLRTYRREAAHRIPLLSLAIRRRRQRIGAEAELVDNSPDQPCDHTALQPHAESLLATTLLTHDPAGYGASSGSGGR